MCFYNDNYEWTADVVEETSGPAPAATKCDECRAVIAAGQFRHHIYMQENEDEFCEWCDFYGDLDCECGGSGLRGPGETFDYDRCENCHKFLQAVEDAEIEAGCSKNEARPSLGYMVDDISNGDKQEAKRYWKKAKSMFPELVRSGYLGMLWRKLR